MSAYTIFAEVYDNFMSDIPYMKWADQITEYLTENRLVDNPILDLGCGTGNFTVLMADKGYQMTGLDVSSDMLKTAINKTRKAGHKITYSLQDMRNFQMTSTFPVVISVCDSMNYLEDFFDLKSTLECVFETLEPGGIFIFDLKTEAFFQKLGNQIFTDENEAGYYIWENDYDESRRNNNYYLTFFIKNFKGLYRKQEETHLQHAFRDDEIHLAAEETGFTVKYMLGMDFKSAADFHAERVYYILERN